ncbi:unnamed protein product [Amoebophrya sp. A120]|nr:unnamed protein product [Amoebophrya sp. A120]|eukprot:GSA120T00010346001.1
MTTTSATDMDAEESRYRAHGALMLTAWGALAPLLICMVFLRRKILLETGGTTPGEGPEKEKQKEFVNKLMLMHKLGQPVTLILVTVAITLPFMESHAAHGHLLRRLAGGGGHSSMSLHGVIGFLVLSLAWVQLFLWLGKKFYLKQPIFANGGEQLENFAGVVNGNSKVASSLGEQIPGGESTTAKEDLEKNLPSGTATGAAVSAATSAAEKQFSENWLWVHRVSGLLCLLLAWWNLWSGSHKIKDMFDVEIFTPLVIAFIAVSVIMLVLSRTVLHKLVV